MQIHLRKLRNRLGLKQRELAEQLGVSRNSVTNWETGRALPSLQMLAKIAEALEVHVWELFGDWGTPLDLARVTDELRRLGDAMDRIETVLGEIQELLHSGRPH